MDRPRIEGLVLAGGGSRRMGAPKPFVPFHGIPLIQHVVERLRPVFDTLRIVARDPEPFSFLSVPVIQDASPRRGPLVGVYSGLAATEAEWCFVVGCDMPFLSPAVIRHMEGHLGGNDVVVAKVQGRVQFLHAFYSTRCLPAAAALLDDGNTSLKALLQRCRTIVLPERPMARLDPELLSFRDIDSPAELAALGAERPVEA